MACILTDRQLQQTLGAHSPRVNNCEVYSNRWAKPKLLLTGVAIDGITIGPTALYIPTIYSAMYTIEPRVSLATHREETAFVF